MENENDYELVREPKPKGYVRLTRRKPPSPMEKKKKSVPACEEHLWPMTLFFVVVFSIFLVWSWVVWVQHCVTRYSVYDCMLTPSKWWTNLN
jgi:hypothetical protein